MNKVVSINKKLRNNNIHTHSCYCDGVGEILDYVNFACKNNFSILGFSSHAPLKFETHFSIKEMELDYYVKEIRKLNTEKHQDMKILAGLECDYIRDFSFPFDSFKNKYQLDYIIGGVHLVENLQTKKLWFIDGPFQAEFDRGLQEVFDNDIKKGVTQYFYQMMEMIEKEDFEVLAHIDKIKMHNGDRFFKETDQWYQNLCLDVVDLLSQKNIIVEINTRGIYKKRCPDFYPSRFILQNLFEKKVRITASSDAHKPEELNLLLNEAANFAKEVGYKEFWYPTSLDKWSPYLI